MMLACAVGGHCRPFPGLGDSNAGVGDWGEARRRDRRDGPGVAA
jgi:hypothetical protein